jgi:uncharacterized protein with PQ loop repeat
MSPELLGWLASVVYLARLLPQPVRLARTGVPVGVSTIAAMNAVISDVAWISYGLGAGLVPVWLVAVIGVVPGVWTVALLRSEIRRRDLFRSGIWLALIGLAALAGLLGVVLAASVLVNMGPQVWKALRSSDLRGLSALTWLIAIGDGVLWGAYGWVVGDGALVGYGVVLVSSALVVLARMAQTRSFARPLPATSAPVLDPI